jgi:hypothetical protein
MDPFVIHSSGIITMGAIFAVAQVKCVVLTKQAVYFIGNHNFAQRLNMPKIIFSSLSKRKIIAFYNMN